MYRLVYTSTAKTLMSERGLQQILRSARRSNAMNLVTGMLVYHDGCFLQVLEGPQEAVEKCYKHILKDPRHRDCITLSSEPVVSRLFSAWWMSYQSHDDMGHSQKKQFLSLRRLAAAAQDGQLLSDLKTNALLLAFLSAFRDLDMAG